MAHANAYKLDTQSSEYHETLRSQFNAYINYLADINQKYTSAFEPQVHQICTVS